MTVNNKDIEVIHQRIEKYSDRQGELIKQINKIEMEVALMQQLHVSFEKEIRYHLQEITDLLKEKKNKIGQFIKQFISPIATAVILYLMLGKI